MKQTNLSSLKFPTIQQCIIIMGFYTVITSYLIIKLYPGHLLTICTLAMQLVNGLHSSEKIQPARQVYEIAGETFLINHSYNTRLNGGLSKEQLCMSTGYCPHTVQLRCNFTLAHKQFTHTLEQFTRACIELLVVSVLLPTRNSCKIIRLSLRVVSDMVMYVNCHRSP